MFLQLAALMWYLALKQCTLGINRISDGSQLQMSKEHAIALHLHELQELSSGTLTHILVMSCFGMACRSSSLIVAFRAILLHD